MKRAFILLSCLLSCATASPRGALVTASSGGALVELPGAKPPAQGREKTLLEVLFGAEQEPAVCPADGLLKLIEGIDDDSADKLIRTLEACKGRRVVIEIDSPGGSVFAAIRLQKAIERHDKAVMCVVDGLAASAAFVTLQACTSRYATARSMLMAHTASLGTKGQEHDLRNGAEALRVVNWGMIEFCARRMGMAHEAFESHVANGAEWYLSQADGLTFKALDGPAKDVAEIVELAGK